MKHLQLFIVLIIVILSLNAKAQTYTTLVATNSSQASLDIPSNTLAVVTHVTQPYFSTSYPNWNAFYRVGVTIGGVSAWYYPVVEMQGGALTSGTSPRPIINNNWPVVTGPATITLINDGWNALVFCTIQTTPINQVNFTPNNAVVIPNDSNGPVNIIMESSSDMVNWTPALPGTYGTTSSNRFFRVRETR